MIENHSEFSGAGIAAINLSQVNLDQPPNSPHASILRRPCAYYSTRTLFTRRCRLYCVIAININYQRSPKTEQFMTARISGNASKQGSRIHCATSTQFTTAKIQGCAIVSSHSNRSEGMRLGWGHSRVAVTFCLLQLVAAQLAKPRISHLLCRRLKATMNIETCKIT